MENVSIAFIGAGRMVTSLVGGLIGDDFPAASIWVSAPEEDELIRLQTKFSVNTTLDNKKAANEADVIVIGVKPQTVPLVAQELSEVIRAGNILLVSIAAGIRQSDLC
ncbi:MAG: NAD(P)-binding domain-containing protein, partial [Gammaproteobacteria bacterium]